MTFATQLPQLGTVYAVAEWLIRIVMTLVVPFRRSPGATRSWLLLILFLPIPGLLLFLAIGRPKFPQWRADRFAKLKPFYEDLGKRLIAAGRDSGFDADIALVDEVGGLPAVGGNRVELLDDYDAAVAQLIADIDCAQHHVRITVYIFADDVRGMAVIAALGRAVTRGVPCHVLVDPVGSRPWLKHTLETLRERGVETRETLPFRFFRGRTRRDMRNHRKLFMIDGRIGYAGSQNLVAKDFKPGVVNRELVARVEGPVVAEMTAAFIADWFLETEVMLDAEIAIPSSAGDITGQLLPSGADYSCEGFATFLVWKIHNAKRRVVITTPYLIPDKDLTSAMRTAVLRGVTVDLIVSKVSDQALVSLAQRSYYREFLDAGVNIHRFRRELLHAKNVCIDGTVAILGSSNVDIRSFQLNEEVSLILYGEAASAPLEAVQRGYLENSDRVDSERWTHRPRLQKIGENLARLVSPLL